MKLKFLLAGCLLAVAAAMPAVAQTVYTAVLAGGPAEDPPNASLGTGTATVTVDVALNTMRVEASFSGLSGVTTASHIHCCTAVAGTGTAGVATEVPFFSSFPIGVSSGTYDSTFDMLLASSYNPAFVTAHGGTLSQAFSDLVAGLNAGSAYLNIHSDLYPRGEIRGFLQAAAAVPEPQTYALLATGLGLLALVTRRRRSATQS
jgi:hypothetical protein